MIWWSNFDHIIILCAGQLHLPLSFHPLGRRLKMKEIISVKFYEHTHLLFSQRHGKVKLNPPKDLMLWLDVCGVCQIPRLPKVGLKGNLLQYSTCSSEKHTLVTDQSILVEILFQTCTEALNTLNTQPNTEARFNLSTTGYVLLI